MSDSEKNIIVQPNVGSTNAPEIDFISADASSNAKTISLKVYPTSNGTLSFEGNTGQLFSITDSMSGTIFSVNDISGIPSIEVVDDGTVKLAQYSGNVAIGKTTANSKVDIQGDLNISTTYEINGTTVLSSSSLGSGVTGSSLTSVGTITSGTWSGSFGAVSGANLTGLTAGNLSGTIPSAVLGNSTHYVGTTAIALNRASGSQTLTGVSVDGNAATATALQTARTIGGVSFNGTANINLPGVNTAGNQNTSGNAATATTLQTARTINGTSFNGSANITTANWGTARTLTIGSTGKSVDGSAAVSWSLAEIGAAASSHTHSYLPLSGGTITGDTYFEGPILWKVSSSDAAHQRADARDDATNYSRLHWYGVTDTAATSNFRHAWFDGAAYINIDVSSSNINFARTTGTANLQVHGNTVLHAGNYNSYSPTLTGTGASGSWGINVTGSSASCTGNAATATTATNTSGGTVNANYIGISNTSGSTGYGISLYAGATTSGSPTYGLFFGQTATFGTYGTVSSDWATYFTTNNTANRGWIFRNNTTPTNVASINNSGSASFAADVRAPIFYDLNDTGYYINPNSTSNVRFIEGHNTKNFRGGSKAINDWDYNRTPTNNSNDDGSWYIDSGTTNNWSYGTLSKHAFRRIEGLTLEYDAYLYPDDGAAAHCMIGFCGGDSTSYAYNQTPADLIYHNNGSLAVYTNASSSGADYSFDTRNAWWRFKTVLRGSGADHYVWRDSQWNLIKATTTNNIESYEWVRVLISHYSQIMRIRNMQVYVAQSQSIRSDSALISSVAGKLTVPTDIRSPIFYDLDNTAYYVNPASTSNLNAITTSSDQAIVNQHNGNSTAWYGRILSKNSTSDKAAFIGTYGTICGVFAHNNALSAWADLYVNTVNGTSGGNVRLPSTTYINGVAAVYNSGSWGINVTGSSASCTGNAATATALQTARTINGTSFNGSANITTANWGTARTLTIGSTGKSVDGSAAVSWSLAEIGAAATSHTHNYAGSASAGGPANSLLNFTTTTTSTVGTDNSTSAIGYINSISLFSQTDGGLYSHVYSTSWKHNIFGDYRTGQIAVRGKNNGTWQAWRSVLDSSNYTSYAMPSGSSATNSVDVRAPIFYDSNNTGYYINAAGTSVVTSLDIRGEVYNDGWFRNDTTKKGLYNTATTQYFYSDDDDWWNVGGGIAGNGIRFRDEYDGTIRGAFYANSSNEVGILDKDSQWAYKHIGDSGHYFYSNNTQLVTIDPTGKVGIGTSNPTVRLHVSNISSGTNQNWNGGTDFINLLASGTGTAYSEQSIAFQESGTNIGAKIGVKNKQNGAYDIIFANRDTSSTTSTMYERLRIASSGYVGIGTNSPGYKLDINTTGVRVANGTTGYGYWLFGNHATATNNWHIGSEGDGSFRVYNGTFGAGTQKLYLSSNGSFQLYVGSQSTDGFAANQGGYTIRLLPNITQGSYNPIVNAGNCLINFTNGTQGSGRLVLAPWSSTQSGVAIQASGTTYIYTASGYASFGSLNSGYFHMDTDRPLFYMGTSLDVNGKITLYNAGNRDTYLEPGNLIIRSTNPTVFLRDSDHNSSMLHCNGNTFYVLRGGNDTLSWSTVGSGWWPMTLNLTNNDATFGGNISAAYNITAYASDKRLKENIQEIPNALDKVRKIRGVTFDWNDKADEVGFIPPCKYNDVGVIAQEIEEVLPQVVTLAPFDRWNPDPGTDYTEEELEKTGTSRSGENYKTVQYDRIVPLLIQAIKELSTEVETLKEILGVKNAKV